MLFYLLLTNLLLLLVVILSAIYGLWELDWRYNWGYEIKKKINKYYRNILKRTFH